MSKRDRNGGGLVFSTDRGYMDIQRQMELDACSIETLVPEAQSLVVRRDTARRKGKVVTLVLGFTGKAEDLEALGKKLKQACGVGGSAKDGEILIQGDVVPKVVDLLREWGYLKTKSR